MPRRKKDDAANMLGPRSTANTISDKVKDLKRISDEINRVAARIEHLTKNDDPKSRVEIMYEGVTCYLNLEALPGFEADERRAYLLKARDLALEFLYRQMQALHREIIRMGSDL